MNCNKCGAVIPNDAKFCCYCGSENVEISHNHDDITVKLNMILDLLSKNQPEHSEKNGVKSQNKSGVITPESKPVHKVGAAGMPTTAELKKGYYIRDGILMFCFDKKVQTVTLELDDSVKEASGLKIYNKLSRVNISGNITQLPKGLIKDCRNIAFLNLKESSISQIYPEDLEGTGICQLDLPSCFKTLNSGSFDKDNSMYLVSVSADHFFEVKPNSMPASLLTREIFNINGFHYTANQVYTYWR